jgi:hypothetical protein
MFLTFKKNFIVKNIEFTDLEPSFKMLNCAFKNIKSAYHENIDFYNMTHSRSMNKNGSLKFISPAKKCSTGRPYFFSSPSPDIVFYPFQA